MRTYSGHSSARASNELYRTNLREGQTGLSIAFDLPTQTGYDSDDPMARSEVGKVGVPVPTLAEMRTLFDDIPIEEMNTSMTINATAMWLLALYLALAEERGVDASLLAGTTQNDVMKEFLSRGTYIFGPQPSLRLTVDVITHTVQHVPKWNPINVCSYHLQEAGATPVQELAYSLATAVDVLDAVRASGRVPDDDFASVFERISFFVNAGIRFVEETCKMRAFTRLWDRLGKERYGVTSDKARRFRYGVQVNSLGLTAAQPENNVQRIVLETLGVTLSKSARAPRGAAARVERGARLAATVGPAVVAAHPAGARVRDRPARVRRHLRRLEGDRGEDRRARGGRAGRARPHRRRRRRVREHRRPQGPARAERGRAHAQDRVGRHHARRRQHVPRDRGVAAHREHRRRGLDPRGRRRPPTHEQIAALQAVARAARRRRGRRRRSTRCDGSRPMRTSR